MYSSSTDYTFDNYNSSLEVQGLHSYCFTKPFEFNSSTEETYKFAIKIARLANPKCFSIGFSEEYLSGKHYDTLVGFGFGIFGFNADCEYKYDSSVAYTQSSIEDRVIRPGDTLEFEVSLNKSSCIIKLNEVHLYSVSLPKIELYFCVSSSGYSGINSIILL